MKHAFLNKTGSRSLIILFAGWGMDSHPFTEMSDWNHDVVIAFDYSDRNFENLDVSGYDTTILVAWSFGVFAAGRWMAETKFRPTTSIAINGTLRPIDDIAGIPTVIFNGTLENLNDTTLRKFFRRMCSSTEQFAQFMDRAPKRPLESLRSELIAIREEAKTQPEVSTDWDKSYIASDDRIIPTLAQKTFWHSIKTAVVEIQGTHLPVNFLSLIQANVIDKNLVKTKFGKSWPTYDDFADCQKIIAQRLLEKWRTIDCRKRQYIYEVGCGTGLFTKLYVPAFSPKEIVLNDIAMPPVNLGKEINCSHRFHIADAEYTVPEGIFDSIVSSSAVQWFENPANFLKRMNKILADNGLFVCATFGEKNLQELRAISGTSLNYLKCEDWIQALKNAGLTPISVESEIISLSFDSPLDLLRSLKCTGVNALQTPTVKRPKDLIASIERQTPHTEGGKLRLTYNPIYILATKNKL